MKQEQLTELLYQALETEKGGVKVYETALRCAQNDDLKEEWEKYLEQTQNHEQIVLEVFEALGLDPEHGDARAARSCATSASRSSRPWRWRSKRARRRPPSWWPPSASSTPRPRTT